MDEYDGPVWRCLWCTTVYASQRAAEFCDCDTDD